jgi:DNA gyrase subunit B
MSNTAYTAENISVLEGLEAVRKRPGMYIGNTGSEGLHRCAGEIIDNSIDENMAGHATTMKVVIFKNGSLLVSDDGRGIPTDIHPKTGKSAVETIMTVLHAGGKFDQDNYQFSGGLHGVGASVVNALSTKMEVWVFRKDKVHYIQFAEGKTKQPLEEIDETLFASRFPQAVEHRIGKGTGTMTWFVPDQNVFEVKKFNAEEIRDYLQKTAYLNKGIRVLFYDENTKEELEFFYPDGIKTYLEDLTAKDTLMTPIFLAKGDEKDFIVEFAIAYAQEYNEKLIPFTNGIINPEGGMHVTGFRTALTKVVNQYCMDKKLFKKDTEKFTAEDLKEGLRAILSLRMVDPQFTSQSKVKLGSTQARTRTDKIVQEHLTTYLEENPTIAQAIHGRATLAMKARLAARAARDSVLRKGVLESLALPGKLADCSEKSPEKSELFIVEGDSAGGSAKQGRDRHTQAILPLRGKVLNTEKANLERVLNYEGIRNMILALGCGIGDKFDIDKLRYYKIVIMTDADVDGAHIMTLLLTFFYRYLPQLLENGHIYMARPPLFRLQAGKLSEYVYSDIERDQTIKRFKKEKGEDVKINIQRYKGLGEMNGEQLWDTTMDPSSRLLWQVTVGEAAQANLVFEELMGPDVAPRKKFIEENALFVDEIDL